MLPQEKSGRGPSHHSSRTRFSAARFTAPLNAIVICHEARMIGTTGTGWLFSLARGSNWGGVDDFYKAVAKSARRRRRIIVESDVWGTLRSLAATPVAGDGFAFYHSKRATFPSEDPFKRRPRISLMGELLDIRHTGRDLEHIAVAIDPQVLRAMKVHPLVRDDTTQDLFESCGIVPGAVATLYYADHPTWAAFVASVEENAI
jgi:hypothetical protein